jgi:hypothetical protein
VGVALGVGVGVGVTIADDAGAGVALASEVLFLLQPTSGRHATATRAAHTIYGRKDLFVTVFRMPVLSPAGRVSRRRG